MRTKQALVVWSCVMAAALPSGAQSGLLVDWPVGDSNGNQMVPGYGFRVMQRYGNHYTCVDKDNGVWVIIRDQTELCPSPPCHFCPTDPRVAGLASETTGEGYRVHAGIDFDRIDNQSTLNAPVYAAADGVVDCVAAINYPGSVVVIRHADGYYTMYGHLDDDVLVEEEDSVTRGQQIGVIGDHPAGAHLHYEVRTFLEAPVDGCAGDGYSAAGTDDPGTEGYLDPAAEYYRPTLRRQLPVTVIANPSGNSGLRVRPAPTVVGNEPIVELPRGARVPALAQVADRDDPFGKYWYKIRYDQRNEGYVAAYWVGEGFSGEILSLEQDRLPYQSPAGCTCEWGADFLGSPIPPENTFCAFEVCGADAQFYRCVAPGWLALGGQCSMPGTSDPTGCRCEQGFLLNGDPIDPDTTFCGMQVCGRDAQTYTCESGGWSGTGQPCS